MKRELLEKDVLDILESYFQGSSQQALKESYGVSEKVLYNILYRKTYREISDKFINKHYGLEEAYFAALDVRRLNGLRRTK